MRLGHFERPFPWLVKSQARAGPRAASTKMPDATVTLIFAHPFQRAIDALLATAGCLFG